MRFVLLLAVLLAAACSTAEPEPAAVTAPPAAVVADALVAIAEIDIATLGELVEPVSLAVMAGVENRVRSDEMVALLDGGLEENLATGYWRSFRDDFAAIRGFGVDALEVGGEAAENLGEDFAAVTVSGDDTDGWILLRRSSEKGWQVDMIGTLGPPLVESLGNYLGSALGGAHGDAIAAAYRTTVLPGLDAAIVLDPENAGLVFGTETIRQMLADLEDSAG